MYYGGDTDYFHKLFKPLPRQVPLSEIMDMDLAVFPPYWGRFVSEVPQHRKGYNLTAATPDLLFDPSSDFSHEKHSVAVVARDGRFFHSPEYKMEIREFFSALKPIDPISDDISAFVSQNFGTYTIGVHFRHGNGEATVVPPDFEWFCRSIDDLTARGPDRHAPVFVATDCGIALTMFRARYGDRIISYPKFYLPPGTGGMQYQQKKQEKLQSAIEALTDIRLLSLCQAFVGSKSFFSACANLWGEGFDRTNSRRYVPRLRAFRPSTNQIAVSADPEVLAVFGNSYPVDNLYVDRKSGDIFFQDIVVGNFMEVREEPSKVDRMKETIFAYRLY